MPDHTPSELRVALLADQGAVRARLREVLESRHLNVVAELAVKDWPALDFNDIDVCLVETGSTARRNLEVLSQLVSASVVPILFNVTQPDFSEHSADELARKLARLAHNRMRTVRPLVSRASRQVIPEPASKPVAESSEDERKSGFRVIELPVATRRDAGQRVWVLAASLGGPGALKAFFSELPDQCLDSFLVAQHIGPGHESLLARQLASVSHREVRVASAGMLLGPGEIIVLPASQSLIVDEQGVMQPAKSADDLRYRPSADNMMRVVAERYGDGAGGIVFSGMGDDGVEGLRAIQAAGGVTLAQSACSCMVSTMPDAVREAGLVIVSGSPTQLANMVAGDREALALPG